MAKAKDKQENGETAIAVKGEAKLQERQAGYQEQATAIVVSDQKSAEAAGELRNAARQLLKQIDETFDPLIKQAYDHHKSLLATKRKHADPVTLQIINPLNRKLLDYKQKTDREATELQAKLHETARREQEDRRVNEARELHARGEEEAAHQLIEDATHEPGPVVLVQKEKIAGVGFRDVWRWEITDLTKIPHSFLSVEADAETGYKTRISTAGIGAIVRAIKNADKAMTMVPGIKVWKDEVTA